MTQRKIRHDRGGIRITQRDIQTARVIGHQSAMRIDQIAMLLGVRIAVAYKWVSRMRLASWIDTQQVNSRMWVWLTQRGLRDVELPYRATRPAIIQFDHIYEINQSRLWYARFYPVLEWRSERYLRQSAAPGNQAQHIPDGVLVDRISGDTIAVEVEINPKTFDQTMEIVMLLLQEHRFVQYICSDRAFRVAHTVYNHLIDHQQTVGSRLQVTLLSTIRAQLDDGESGNGGVRIKASG